MDMPRVERRKKLGLTQQDVAEAIRMPQSTVCAIENEEFHDRYDAYLAQVAEQRYQELKARRGRKRTGSPA